MCPRHKGRGDKPPAVLKLVARGLANSLSLAQGWAMGGAMEGAEQLKVPLCVALTDISGRGQLGVIHHLPK